MSALELMLATSTHKGNVGIKTGSSSRPQGKTHIWNASTERTLCGKQRGQMIVHRSQFALEELHVRTPLCSLCMSKTSAPIKRGAQS